MSADPYAGGAGGIPSPHLEFLPMKLRILAPLVVLSLVAVPAMAATAKAPAAKHQVAKAKHHASKAKAAKTTTAPAADNSSDTSAAQ